MIKIDNKIVSFNIKTQPGPETMHEGIARPEVLMGKTYKLKVPSEDSAIYITINDLVLNEGTAHEECRPFEIFINSRNTAHRQWVDTLTRIISAVFRKGGEIQFLVEELKAISDPNGGGFYKGRFIKSVVSEIGHILETHINLTGTRTGRVSNTTMNISNVPKTTESDVSIGSKCSTCGQKAVVQKDGCPTCLACGESKCG